MNCNGKHTKGNPSDDEFYCPNCGAIAGYFHIDEAGEGADEDCPLLHRDDNLLCHKCGHGESGQTFLRRLMKTKNLICCPTCKGKGLVNAGEM